MRRITPKTVVVRKEDLVTASMDDEIVMMSTDTGKYYGLGKTGSVIWGMLGNAVPVEALVLRLLREYQVEKDRCQGEVIAFLEEMEKEGLIEVQ